MTELAGMFVLSLGTYSGTPLVELNAFGFAIPSIYRVGQPTIELNARYEATIAAIAIDTTVPVLLNFIPPLGSLLSSPHQPIQLDISDESGELSAVIVRVHQRGQSVTEVVYEYDQYVEPYSEFSTQQVLEGGTWRMVMRRSGGWSGTPLFRIFALDRSGNINV